MQISVIRTSHRNFESTLRKIIGRRGSGEQRVEGKVKEIIRRVRQEGDRALLRYTRLFDGVEIRSGQIEVGQKEIDRAVARVSRRDLGALEFAAKRIAQFHRRQVEKSWSYRDRLGLSLGQRVNPLERAGVYVPGGKASYPSTVLMNVMPAKVAGVSEIVMARPIKPGEGDIILAAARIAGVDRIFRVGGAQAVAALAYGTRRVPRVDKIVGPGNVYVSTAKRLVFGDVDIDSIAGPSEILLLADAHADPAHVAADMLSQAEHDELAASICVTTSWALATRIQTAIERQLLSAPRRAITLKALKRYGAIVVARNLRDGIEVANRVAPEHVELMVRHPRKWISSIRHAGAIFVGSYSTPPLGDYLAGPNHVLPTGGSARFFSPLGTYDFLKRTSVIEASPRALRVLAPKIAHLARLEGLEDHARAVEARFKGEAS